jgi:hypothetical protein
LARLLPKPRGLVDQVFGAGRNLGVIAYHLNAAGGSPQPNRQAVVQFERLIDGADFVVAVRALAEDFEPQIDLGEGADSKGGLQG